MRIVVCGAGPMGLATALMLKRDGHDVTVLERDAEPLPADPEAGWNVWERSVPQFRQAHFVHARFRQEMERELPDVLQRLKDLGGLEYDQLGTFPPFVSDPSPKPDDVRFQTVTARRPYIEHAIASVAEEEVDVRRGARLEGPLTNGGIIDGVPHITGVRTVDGEELSADLVVDAMGRGSPLSQWIADLGGRPPIEEGGDIGNFTYYTRFFQGDALPEQMGPLLVAFDCFTVLGLPADHNTWSLTLYANSGDQPLKRFREPEVFEKVVRACPLHAHWHDGTPITGIDAMGGVLDKLRTFVVDDQPVVTGAIAAADAWACTNPSLGRGLSIGLIHAGIVRSCVAEHGDDYAALARGLHEATEAHATPWVRAQMTMDEARSAEVVAARDGRPRPDAQPSAMLQQAMLFDADIFRGFMDITACLALPEDVMARPGFMESIGKTLEDNETFPLPGPERSQLLELVA